MLISKGWVREYIRKINSQLYQLTLTAYARLPLYMISRLIYIVQRKISKRAASDTSIRYLKPIKSAFLAFKGGKMCEKVKYRGKNRQGTGIISRSRFESQRKQNNIRFTGL